MHAETEDRLEDKSTRVKDRTWKLKGDAFFVRVSDGVEVQNSKGSYRVQGKSAFALIDWIFKRFQTPANISEVCAGMPAEKRAVIERQIETLATRGFLREVVLPVERIPPWAEVFSDLIEFIDQFEDAPFSRFQMFREKRFLCVGRGLALMTFLEALAVYGAKTVDVLFIDDGSSMREAIASLQDRTSQAEFNVRMNNRSLSGQEDSAFLQLDGEFDCALVALGLNDKSALDRISASILEGSKPLSIVGCLGNFVIGSALFLPDADFCWECMYRTLYLHTSVHDRQGPTPAALAVACNHVIHNLFCYYTGVNRQLLSHCAVVNCDSLATSTHLVNRHPACHRHKAGEATASPLHINYDHDSIRPDLPSSDDSAELVKLQDQIISWSDQLTDPVAGPFLALDEGNLPQLPLSQSRCLIPKFASAAGAMESRELIAQGISTRETRNQVALFGLEYLADEVLNAQTAVARELLRQLNVSGSTPVAAVGAGWSTGEAIYRALHQNALSWAARSEFSVPMRVVTTELLQDSPLIRFFADAYPMLLEGGYSMHVSRVGSGMAVARLSTHSGRLAWGAGLNELHACENAAAKLAVRSRGDESGTAVLRAVYLVQETGLWPDVLQRNGIVLPNYLDAGALLPACHGKAFLVLVQT